MLSLIGVAVPVFFLAFLLKYWFAIEQPIFPVSGRQDSIGCTRVTGFFVLDGLLTREFDCSDERAASTSSSRRSRSRPSRSP